MRIRGRILNASTSDPVGGARVLIRIGNQEVATHSGSGGQFDWRDDRSHVGEVIEVRVRKEGFFPWDTSREVSTSELEFEVSLQPARERPVTRRFLIRDTEGEPVAGAEFRLEGPAGATASGISDDRGEARITIPVDMTEPAVDYTAGREGFVKARGRVDLSGPDPIEIVVERSARAAKRGKWIVIGSVLALVAILLLAFILDRRRPSGPAERIRVQPAEVEPIRPERLRPGGTGAPRRPWAILDLSLPSSEGRASSSPLARGTPRRAGIKFSLDPLPFRIHRRSLTYLLTFGTPPAPEGGGGAFREAPDKGDLIARPTLEHQREVE